MFFSDCFLWLPLLSPCFSSRAPAWQSKLSPNMRRLQSFAATSLFGFPSCASVWCLVLNRKAQRLHFYKVPEQCIWYKPHFSEVSSVLPNSNTSRLWVLGQQGCPMVTAGGRQGTLPVPWRYLQSWEAHENQQYSFFGDEAAQTNTISAWLEVTDGVKILKRSLQTGVQGWVQPLFTTLCFTAQPLRLASKLHTIITWRSVCSRGFPSEIQQRNKQNE